MVRSLWVGTEDGHPNATSNHSTDFHQIIPRKAEMENAQVSELYFHTFSICSFFSFLFKGAGWSVREC